jgi:bisphosphoglycerate-independent phosphoglycerate mutase (AlkP superfamily)
MQEQAQGPVVLVILDGFGHREDPRDNAIAGAEYTDLGPPLVATTPHTLIRPAPAFGRGPARVARWATPKSVT